MKLLPLAMLSLFVGAFAALDEEAWVGEPIRYDEAERDDVVTRLHAKLEAGEVQPEWDEQRGWLPAVLEQFGAPASSQVLVFSKTSFQRNLISPETPRALYFADDVYIGWIPGAPIMEITTIDPVQGPTFYTLEQERERLHFERSDDECLDCHGSSRTRGWPGNLVRSVHPAADGEPILRAGTYRTTQSSPLEERWGGWYVTGEHGEQRHMGNAVVQEDSTTEFVDRDVGANVTDLSTHFDVARYPSGHSDLVALMVMEHQAEMHNLIARASYEARAATDYQRKLNEFFDEPEDFVSDPTQRRYQHAAQALVDELLFREELQLAAPVSGTSSFTEEFVAAGKRDTQGRSLRDFDLEGRLFRYPCSFLIHSEAFDALPQQILERVWGELWEILNGREVSRDFSSLSKEDRAAILEILLATKSGLPAKWRRGR